MTERNETHLNTVRAMYDPQTRCATWENVRLSHSNQDMSSSVSTLNTVLQMLPRSPRQRKETKEYKQKGIKPKDFYFQMQ